MEEKRRVRGYIPLWIAEAVYMGLLVQIFTTVPLLVIERVQPDVLGWTIPVAWYSLVGTVALIIVLALLGSLLKGTVVGRSRVTTKFTIGLTVIGIAYLLLLLTELYPPGRTVPPLLILFCLAVAGSTEALVAPIGYSVVTRIAPAQFRNQMIALKILTLGAASVIAGIFGTLYTHLGSTAFWLIGMTGILSAMLLISSGSRIEGLLRSGQTRS